MPTQTLLWSTDAGSSKLGFDRLWEMYIYGYSLKLEES